MIQKKYEIQCKEFGKIITNYINKFKHKHKHMVKTITIMDDAYDKLKRSKAKDESFSDTIRRVCDDKKINWEQWFGILKGGEERAKEMQEVVKKLRAKMKIRGLLLNK